MIRKHIAPGFLSVLILLQGIFSSTDALAAERIVAQTSSGKGGTSVQSPPSAGGPSSASVGSSPQVSIPSVFSPFYIVGVGNDADLTIAATTLAATIFQEKWSPYTPQTRPAFPILAGSIAVVPQPTWSADTLAMHCQSDPHMLGGAIIAYNESSSDQYYLVWATETSHARGVFQIILCANKLPVLVYYADIASHTKSQGEFPVGPVAALASIFANGGKTNTTTTTTKSGSSETSVTTTTNGGNFSLSPWVYAGAALLAQSGSVNLVGYAPFRRAIAIGESIAADLPDARNVLCLNSNGAYGNSLDSVWQKRYTDYISTPPAAPPAPTQPDINVRVTPSGERTLRVSMRVPEHRSQSATPPRPKADSPVRSFCAAANAPLPPIAGAISDR